MFSFPILAFVVVVVVVVIVVVVVVFVIFLEVFVVLFLIMSCIIDIFLGPRSEGSSSSMEATEDVNKPSW